MRAICLYLHIHQPIRYREYPIFDVSNNSNYFHDHYDGRQSNERIFRKVADKSYHPMLDLLERNMSKYPGFKISISITGTWLEQAEQWAPELLAQIRRKHRAKVEQGYQPLALERLQEVVRIRHPIHVDVHVLRSVTVFADAV